MTHERESGAVVVDPLGGLLLDPPHELKFKGPFDDYVTVSLSIRNPTDKRIAFKIKTTAPKRYCVKPNSGVLDSAQSMKVNVLLQPFNYDPNEKNKHKFMVQYVYLNDAEMSLTVNDILNMWKDISASRLLDLKLKCLFEFTEAEQQRLSQLTPQTQNDSVSVQTVSTKFDTASSQQSEQIQAQQPPKKSATSSSSSAATTTTNSTSNKSNSNTNNPYNNNTSSLDQTNDQTGVANDFESFNKTTSANNKTLVNNTTLIPNTPNTNTNNTNTNTITSANTNKNDNLVNELKQSRQENESLKKEISRLKDEESRLRKLALQSPSSTSTSSRTKTSDVATLDDLLNNRLLIVVFILIAVIVYLILFR